MNQDAEGSQLGLLTALSESGPLELVLLVIMVGFGVYHTALSVRVLTGHHAPVPLGFHCLVLFSPPALLVLSVMVVLPTTFPDLFIFGIDADQPLKHALEFTSFLSSVCLGIFVLNLGLTICACNRDQHRANMNPP